MSLNFLKTAPKGSGKLCLVATPIGNPGDLTPRAAEALEKAAFVLAEDTRRSGELFARWGIKAQQFISFHEHNEEAQIEFVLAQLKAGKNVALISDAGMPVLSDPGFRLVRKARSEGIVVSPLPGPSAILAALAASGLAPQPFSFLGFSPRKQREQERIFTKFKALASSLVFFERKDRLAETLQTAHTCLGKREVCIARELSKTHEEFIFGVLGKWTEPTFPPENLLGEITLVLGPPLESERSTQDELFCLVASLTAKEPGLKPREQARKLSELACGWSIKEIYSLLQAK